MAVVNWELEAKRLASVLRKIRREGEVDEWLYDVCHPAIVRFTKAQKRAREEVAKAREGSPS